jgi:hypothetical protein
LWRRSYRFSSTTMQPLTLMWLPCPTAKRARCRSPLTSKPTSSKHCLLSPLLLPLPHTESSSGADEEQGQHLSARRKPRHPILHSPFLLSTAHEKSCTAFIICTPQQHSAHRVEVDVRATKSHKAADAKTGHTSGRMFRRRLRKIMSINFEPVHGSRWPDHRWNWTTTSASAAWTW